MATVEELLRLRGEVTAKIAKVKELEDTMAQLQEELARLKGEVPPVAAVPKKVWYKRWTTWALLGGLGTLITGIAIGTKKKKK